METFLIIAKLLPSHIFYGGKKMRRDMLKDVLSMEINGERHIQHKCKDCR